MNRNYLILRLILFYNVASVFIMANFKVNFEDRAPLADEENFDEIAPMQGRYKNL